MQTFFVFLKQKGNISKLSIKQKLSIYIFVGISSYSFCCLPWILLMVIRNMTSVINYLCLLNSFFAFAYLYGTVYHILLNTKHSIKSFEKLDFLGLIFFPFYFLLHTIASYMAIWESISQSFKWNKTTHSLSDQEKAKNMKKIKGGRKLIIQESNIK